MDKVPIVDFIVSPQSFAKPQAHSDLNIASHDGFTRSRQLATTEDGARYHLLLFKQAKTNQAKATKKGEHPCGCSPWNLLCAAA
jgi:hypothetical protein